MSIPFANDHLAPVTFTAEEILRLKSDYESDVRLLEQLPARIKLKKRRFDAALLFAPAGFDPNAELPDEPVSAPVSPQEAPAAPEPVAPAALPATSSGIEPEPTSELESDDFELTAASESSSRRLTWVGELMRILRESGRGLSHKEALTMLKATPLGDNVSAGEKGFYNAVLLCEKRGDLIKSGGRLYSKELVAAMKARGEPLPDVTIETRRRAGGAASVVVEVLKMNPSGLDASGLRRAAAATPGVSGSVAKHSHYIYNVLGTLIGQGIVTKGDDGLYRLKNASEA